MIRWFVLCQFALILAASAFGATYYVSSSEGDDNNDGLATDRAFETIAHVNTLLLNPGDQVLFKCGDRWRGETLRITRSGSAALPIRYASYPDGCADKPIISGAFPVTGWTPVGGQIYVADLDLGGNAGSFPMGMNQLFRDGTRLSPGRWPNLDEGDAGYSEIESQPASDRIQDNQLPAVSWDGALVHIKGMRWYIINRYVTQTTGSTLVLNEDAGCWDNDCTDWGFFLNNHPATLDQDGEWFFDAASNQVHIYSDNAPANMEASAIMATNDDFRGGILLGRHLQEHISYVIIDNFEVSRWDMHGITTPTNLQSSDNFNLTIQNNHVQDVDAIGINLQTWVWDAAVGPNGWRGGHDHLVANNLVEGANHMGINTYTYDSDFIANHLRDIGLIEAAGLSGIGCGDTSFGGFCTEYGDGFRIKIDQVAFSGFGNLLQCNRLERIGHNGVDIFGSNNELSQNTIIESCYSKGDCGAVRTFGNGNLASTPVHDILLDENLIIDVIGNTDGCAPFFKPLFGIGLYIDHFSATVTASNNTIMDATIDGILYQNSSGTVSGNVLFGNNRGTMFRGQIGLYGSPTRVSLSDNVMIGQQASARTLISDALVNVVASNFNYFFNAFEDANIHVSGQRTLSQWQSFSGMDAQSVANWYQLNPPDPPLAQLFLNNTKDPLQINLGGSTYLDLDQNLVTGSFTLQPSRSRVLVPQFICNPSAVVSGDSTICLGDDAVISVVLTGTAPWDLHWSDGGSQLGVISSPATRMVSPTETTNYELTSFNDSQCAGITSGSATIIVGDSQPLWIEPRAAAQGLLPLSFTAHIPCVNPTLGWTWTLGGALEAEDVNPVTLSSVLTSSTNLVVEVDQGGMPLSAAAVILVSQHPINLDLNGDGCNDDQDLLLLASTWHMPSNNDPNDDGWVDIRDLLYINTDNSGCP